MPAALETPPVAAKTTPDAGAPPSRPEIKPPPEKPPKEYMADVEDDLDRLSQEEEDKAAGKPPKAKEKAKPAPEVKPPEDTEKAPEGEKEPEKGADKPSANPEDKAEPSRMSELRTAYKEVKGTAQTLRKEVEALKRQVEEFKSKPEPDTSPILKERDELKKRLDEQENQIRFLDYSRSDEFQQKYFKPYKDAYDRAVSDFQQLNVRIRDGQDETTGEPKFKARQATADDLIMLANLPLAEMDEAAEAMFGKSSPRVIRHVEKVRELAQAQHEALSKAQKEAGEKQKRTTVEQQEFQKNRNSAFQKANKEMTDRYPKWFAPDPADAPGNELLEKGKALADAVFLPNAENQPKSVEEAAKLHARAYNRIMGFTRLASRLRNAMDRIAELEGDLAQYEKSSPGTGKGGEKKDEKPASFMAESMSELDKLNTEAL